MLLRTNAHTFSVRNRRNCNYQIYKKQTIAPFESISEFRAYIFQLIKTIYFQLAKRHPGVTGEVFHLVTKWVFCCPVVESFERRSLIFTQCDPLPERLVLRVM